MSNARLHRLPDQPLTKQGARLPMARTLIESGLVTPWQVFFALRCQSVWDISLPEVLATKRWVSERHLRHFVADRDGLRHVDLDHTPPSAEVADLLPPAFCLKHNVVPWAKLGATVILATGRPHRLDQLRAALPGHLKTALFAVTDEVAVTRHVALHNRRTLTGLAEASIATDQSCRGFSDPRYQRKALAAFLAFLCVLLATPVAHFPLYSLAIWTILTLLAATGLRLVALANWLQRPPSEGSSAWNPKATSPTALPAKLLADGSRARLPRISVMVPLFREKEIASALIRRLTKLTYPRALLEVVLVLEEKDTVTRQTIACPSGDRSLSRTFI